MRLRIVFMGTPDFAVPTLDAIVSAGHDVVLVVSQPDRRAGRGKQLRSPPVVERARELGLEVAQPKALRSGPFPERFCGLGADVAVVVAYGRILPKRLLDAPRFGCVNVHASLLPRWRGAAPIQAAILQGDPKTGVCTQRMEEGLDTGPLYICEETPIGPRETAGGLYARLAELGAQVAVETLARLPEALPVPQDAGATYAEKIDKASGLVDWTGAARALDRRIRAMTPWPGGWIPWKGGPLKILEAVPHERTGEPGRILETAPRLLVACGHGSLELVTVQAPGKRPVTGPELASGARLQVGDPLQPQGDR